MKKIILFISIFLSVETLHAQNEDYFQDRNAKKDYHKLPTEMSQCESIKDCVLIKGICNSWTPVSESSKEKASKWAHKLNTAIKCIFTKETKPTLICRKGLCDFMHPD